MEKKKEKINLQSLNEQNFEIKLSLRKKKMFNEMMQKRLDSFSSNFSFSDVNQFPINSSLNFFTSLVNEDYAKLQKNEEKFFFLKKKLSNTNNRNDIISALNIIETKILKLSSNSKLKRMLQKESLIEIIINYTMMTNDYYIMLLSSKIILQYVNDYENVRDLIFDNNVIIGLNNQIVNKFAQCSRIIENIIMIFNYIFTKQKKKFDAIDTAIVNTIAINLCNIIDSEHFSNGDASLRFALLWNLFLLLHSHFASLINRIENVLDVIVTYPLTFPPQTEIRNAFSVYCEIILILSYDSSLLDIKNNLFVREYMNKIFPFIFEYIKNYIQLTSREVLCALMILNNVMKFSIDNKENNIQFNNIIGIVSKMINLYRYHMKVNADIPLEMLNFLDIYSSINDESANKFFTVELFNTVFTCYTKNEDAIITILIFIKNVLKYQNENIISILLLQTNFLTVAFKGLTAQKNEDKLKSLKFISFLYEYFSDRKIPYLEINEEFRKNSIFEQIELLYQENANKLLTQHAKSLLEFIDKNNYNNSILDVIKS